jgi:hypothetical protein
MTAHAQRTLRVEQPLRLAASMGVVGMGRDPTFRARGSVVEFATRNSVGPASARFVQRDDTVTVDAWGEGAHTLLDTADGLIGAHDDSSPFMPASQRLRDIARRFAGLRMTSIRPPDLCRRPATLHPTAHLPLQSTKLRRSQHRSGGARLGQLNSEAMSGQAQQHLTRSSKIHHTCARQIAHLRQRRFVGVWTDPP